MSDTQKRMTVEEEKDDDDDDEDGDNYKENEEHYKDVCTWELFSTF